MVHNAVLSSWFLLETGRDNDGGSHDTARSTAGIQGKSHHQQILG